MTIRTLLLALLSFGAAALNGCDAFTTSSETKPGAPLRVIALRDPLTRVRHGEGLEYDLLWHFAESRKAKLVWKWAKTPEEALKMLSEDKADMAAGRWSQDFFDNSNSAFPTLSYENARANLVCDQQWRSQEELSFMERVFGRRSGSTAKVAWIEKQKGLRVLIPRRDGEKSNQEQLTELQPDWKPKTHAGPILEMANRIVRGKADCLITDASTATWLTNVRPTLRVTRELPWRLQKVFVFAPEKRLLETRLTSWFQNQYRVGFINSIRNRYLSFQTALNDLDRKRFAKARVSELLDLMPKFKKLSAEFNLPWQLIAAVAYQESHWNNDAESYTGVRGIMQLTRETARHLGVEDREDLDQSLWGGAKYLRALLNQQPKSLHPRERLAMTLATYNVGPAHVIDAQKLAIERGHSPQSFWDLRLVLPLLSNPAIAADLKYGSARGEEPVEFTERVLAFYDLLTE